MYYRQNGLWTREVSGFHQDSLAKEIVPYEPARNITREYPPTLLIHGTQDTDVPFEESVNMAEQFKEHGVPYIFLPIQKGEHEFVGGNPAQIRDAYHAMMEFMTKYLGNEIVRERLCDADIGRHARSLMGLMLITLSTGIWFAALVLMLLEDHSPKAKVATSSQRRKRRQGQSLSGSVCGLLSFRKWSALNGAAIG
jgi:hypothetical protein